MVDFERFDHEQHRLSSDLSPLRIGACGPADSPNRREFLEFPVANPESVIVKFVRLVVQSTGIKVHVTDF
ncbi:hypothetical protein RZS08_12785 [Arthrospira platensis SPKY1]|nr:hypothetical protein [Arthrospira platensis SPKY1]